MSEGQRSDWSCCAILPPEIIEDVLSRLPVKSLCRFKCVSPSWKSLISSPHFSKTHLNRTNNALSWSRMQETAPIAFSISVEYLCGVGYDSSKDDYKVVMIWSPDVESGSESGSSTLSDATIVAVYSLENDAWRIIRGPRYIIDRYSHGVYCNGRLHWVCWWDCYHPLVAFDLGDEIFSEVPLPASFDDNDILALEVVILGGHLCLGCVLSCPGTPAEVWMMKKYGDRESWAKFFIATCPMTLRGLVEDNEYLLVTTRPKHLFRLYNPEIGMLRDIVAPIPNAEYFFGPLGTYVESLVSPIR